MQPLPCEFLTQMARKYQLSPEQEEAFVERFSSKESEQAIAHTLHISDNAFRTRMSGVYRKFSINGKGPGKFHKLYDFLLKEYQKSHPSPIPDVPSHDIHALVQEVRKKIKPDIQERCGKMRVLDMTHPIRLNDIYTNVTILEKITARRRLGIDELLQQCTREDFNHFGLAKITKGPIPGLEAVKKHPKLMILGKPGAGKTTFLKYLAIQCIGGKFYSHLVPIFITLKDFAEASNKPGLQEYIYQQLAGNGVETLNFASLRELINRGRMLILLDGLDEVGDEDSKRILKEIREFSDQFRDNHFVITCRIAAREYTFENFTEVEVADFDDEQIVSFATKWFKDKAVKPETFIKRVEDNQRVKELATSPLLLTLLCLAFEESGDFPANRSELYKEGLDALLKKWDAKRGIQRDQIYKKLSVQRKEDLLSKMALTTFEQGNYFFKQQIAEQYITEYIRNLPGASTDEEALQLDSERVLKSIEAQHGLLVERAKGIYSFSHLTFHEYFTAREYVVVKQSSEVALQNLVSHINDKRWREVLFLALGMSPSADNLLLLMKEKVDAILVDDEKLLQFLTWVNQKSLSVEAPFKSLTIREFYINFDSDLNFEFSLTSYLAKPGSELEHENSVDFVISSSKTKSPTIHWLSIALSIDIGKSVQPLRLLSLNAAEFELDNALISALEHAHKLASAAVPEFKVGSHLVYALNRAITSTSNHEIQRSLRRFKQQIADPDKDRGIFKTLWRANGKAWTEKLKALMIQHRNIGHDWQFSDEQKELLKQYYDANKLLVESLNSDCYVSREVRQKIEDELLLPIAEIKKCQQEIL
ncbi:NACHT domain-containing protein [Fischerella sp. PCC 9605]|uniref:NACHT domain-containing protein n=1 Tax=Fischerella sp. PCC 9605 TaxID=1173024 RepID=UPI0004BA10C1|nr:NACHT domain-containing NTPase [Fischerella sp. PCC 9605]